MLGHVMSGYARLVQVRSGYITLSLVVQFMQV